MDCTQILNSASTLSEDDRPRFCLLVGYFLQHPKETLDYLESNVGRLHTLISPGECVSLGREIVASFLDKTLLQLGLCACGR